MKRFRVLWRFGLVALMTAVLLAIRFMGMPLALASPRLERRYLRAITLTWGWFFARIIRMRVEVSGEPPEPPFFLVANHLGYIDTFLLVGLTGGVFVSRADVASWPLAGIVARGINTIFIDRSRIRDTARVNRLIHEELNRGAGVIVYAEAGTGPGDRVRPFKSSLLEPAIALNLPVHYCAIRYETYPGDPPASTAVVWHGPTTFLEHVQGMLGLKGFVASVAFGTEPLRGENRKELAARLQQAVQERFEPVR